MIASDHACVSACALGLGLWVGCKTSVNPTQACGMRMRVRRALHDRNHGITTKGCVSLLTAREARRRIKTGRDSTAALHNR